MSAFAGDELDLYVEFDPTEGDLDLVVFDASGTEAARAAFDGYGQALQWPVPSDGAWFIEVQMVQDLGVVPGIAYALDTEISGFP